MISGKNFAQVRSLGTSTIIYGDIDLSNIGVANQGGNVAILRDATNNNLLFDVSKDRPKSISDITLTKQYRVAGTTDGSGNVTLTCSSLVGGGKVWDDGNSWIATADDDGTGDPALAVTIAGTGATAGS
ncbi:MAG: hypothetical protein ACKVJK_21405, partial [Methylophagaceae bacterium]